MQDQVREMMTITQYERAAADALVSLMAGGRLDGRTHRAASKRSRHNDDYEYDSETMVSLMLDAAPKSKGVFVCRLTVVRIAMHINRVYLSDMVICVDTGC